jgi:lipopolysaccharide export system permease protein
MGILTKYLLRALAGPFLFAFSALTGLLFLNAVAQRMESLVGKGIGWNVVGEFLLLSLPHTVALTLPMAILVSVLYTFSELTAGNEITAMSAGGVKPIRLMLPLLGVGAIFALGMLYFNDEVLPEANHDLKALILDLGRKSPTFNLKEQVVNEIDLVDRSGSVFLVASEIDNATSELRDVVIYDLSDPTSQRTTYADRGEMAFNATQTDLYLTLYDGVVHETRNNEIGAFSRARFQKQIVPLRGVGTQLERRESSGYRSDRELSLIQLQWQMTDMRRELRVLGEATTDRSMLALDGALGVPPMGAEATRDRIQTESSGPRGARRRGSGPPPRQAVVERDALTRGVAYETRHNVSNAEQVRANINRYRVEWHKKFAIAYACLVFVLLGAPLAIRFPRGGVGMVIAVSVVIFAIYWAGLIGGENLADEGVLPPWLAMWAANIVFTTMGVFLMARMGSEAATNRSEGLVESLVWRLKLLGGRLTTRSARA